MSLSRSLLVVAMLSTPLVASIQMAAPLVVPGESGVETEETNRLQGGRLDANITRREPLSPQFVAALVSLQTEMLRAGRQSQRRQR